MINYSAKLLLFGSYVLGLNSNDSDIDVVCVVPNFINR
jgi:poly(A) polymerase Pap1